MPYENINPQKLPSSVNAVFLQSVYNPPNGELERLLSALKENRPDLHIAYFDWFAPTDIRFAERVDPWVSAYVKKALLRDCSAYLRTTKGHTNLTDYFSDRLHTENPPCEWTTPPSILKKLIVGPSFSTSLDLIDLFEKDRLAPERERSIDLHARIATNGTPWYSAMRKEAAAAVAANFPDLSVAQGGMVSKRTYMRELHRSSLCFSPFGYGEVCWRDFEAIAAGCVLVKPEMSHVIANPDIYRPFETYIPVQWDLSDLNSKVRTALADPSALRQMAERAFDVVSGHLRGSATVELASQLCGIADEFQVE